MLIFELKNKYTEEIVKFSELQENDLKKFIKSNRDYNLIRIKEKGIIFKDIIENWKDVDIYFNL